MAQNMEQRIAMMARLEDVGKKLVRKAVVYATIAAAATAPLFAAGCGEDDCKDDGDCKNGYECVKVCSDSHSCGETYTSCRYTCEEKGSKKSNLNTVSYDLCM